MDATDQWDSYDYIPPVEVSAVTFIVWS